MDVDFSASWSKMLNTIGVQKNLIVRSLITSAIRLVYTFIVLE